MGPFMLGVKCGRRRFECSPWLPPCLLALGSFLATGPRLEGATPYGGGEFQETLDALPTAASFTVLDNWVDNATLPGWYRLLTSDGTATGVETRFRIDDGSASGGSLWSLGEFSSTERALGLTNSSNIPVARFGMRLRNATSETWRGFELTYVGEQWRKGAEGASVLRFAWSLNATSLTDGDWWPVEALDFTAPQTAGPTRRLDGNDPANRRALTAAVTEGVWEPDTHLWLRWTGMDRPSTDDMLAVDDLRFRAIPEPSPVAAAFLWLFALARGGWITGTILPKRKGQGSRWGGEIESPGDRPRP